MNNISNASLLNKEGEAVLLESIKIEGDVRGLLLDARVIHSYKNDTQSSIEAIYNFPLPFSAVLLGVKVTLGGVCLSGVVVEKSKAVNDYEDLISSGDSAILIERTNDHNYCLNLGNLAAGEKCVVELRYAQVLLYEQGNLRLQIPTVLAPRYGDAIGAGKFEPHQEYRSDLLVSYKFELSLRLYGPLISARISSPSHAISLIHSKDDAIGKSDPYMQVRLGREYELDRDFVLNVGGLAQASLSLQSVDYANKDYNVALVSFYPEINQYENEENHPPLSIKVLVDCSGSMAGDSIRSVSDALNYLIDELRPNDRYSLSKFGTRVQHRSRSQWPVNDASLSAARLWIKSLQADMGGTELERALDSTITQASDSAADILLITDGEVYAIDSIIDAATSSKQRIFVVGIGSSPVESHLRRLASATAGACVFIAPREDVTPAVLRMLRKMRYSAYENLRVKWPQGTDIKYQTDIHAAVCNGDSFNVFAWGPSVISGTVELVGTPKGQSEERILAEVEMSAADNSDVVSRIGAYERLKTDELGNVALALEYQLISDETSMLLEHVRADEEKQTAMPSIHKIAQMVPAGWAGMGSVVDVVRHINFPVRRETTDSVDFDHEFSSKGRAEFHKKRIQKILEQKLKETEANLKADKPTRKIRITDRQNPLLWSDPNDRYALTPMGLSDWLITNDGLYLPDSLELLDLIGMPPSVIDWLELCFINEQGVACDEELVMAVFISVMRSPKTMDHFRGMVSSEDWLSDVSNALEENHSGCKPEIILKMIPTFISDLAEMSATKWPKQERKSNPIFKEANNVE